MNPKLAEKHSNKSLAQAIETAKKAELAEEFARLPPLKLVTIHENPRVAKGDAVDASNLPTFTGTRLSSLGKKREARRGITDDEVTHSRSTRRLRSQAPTPSLPHRVTKT